MSGHIRRTGLLWVAAGIVAASVACGRSGERFPGAPVVLISVDTLRSDRVSAYGYRGLEAPSFDRLAGDGVLFERIYSHYPLTLPSHSSIFTGLLPPEHGVRDNLGFALADDYHTLAERLRESGYRTFGVVSSMVLRAATGVGQGFEVYDDRMPTRGIRQRTFAQRRGDAAVEIAGDWLRERRGDEPFFLFVHLFDPHTPYAAPEPFASRYDDPYDAEVAYTDSVVGDLLARLEATGLYDRSLIVLLSDHGEGLGDHVEREHGLTLYREALQVPLLIKLPGSVRAGERRPEPAGLIDVAPTILELLGLAHEDMSGRALLGGSSRPDEPLYAETWFPRYQYGWSQLRSIVADDLHYIEAPRSELFDLARDPAERSNLLPATPVPDEMTVTLAEIGEGEWGAAEVSAEELRQLAALGYVGTGGRPDSEEALPDPKDHLEDLEALWDLVRGTEGPLPDVARIDQLLANAGRGTETFHRAVARTLLERGRVGLAEHVLRPFADSDDPETGILLAKAAVAAGRAAEARGRFERVLQLAPEHPEALSGIGTLLLTEGRFEQAREWLERAVELDPSLSEAWNGLGVVRARSGEIEGAIEAWRQAVDADPAYADAWFNLALAYRGSGRPEEALRAMQQYEATKN